MNRVTFHPLCEKVTPTGCFFGEWKNDEEMRKHLKIIKGITDGDKNMLHYCWGCPKQVDPFECGYNIAPLKDGSYRFVCKKCKFDILHKNYFV